jgi:hypothetical protein
MDYLQKLKVGVLYLDVEHWQWCNDIRKHMEATLLGPNLYKSFISILSMELTMWDT